MVVFLFWYPLRHIHWGIDWWDTGYNYANFAYAGLEHMDSMWFFSTYLANVVGHGLTMLPGGDCLVGMNLYTGLFVSVLALMGYFFCTRKLQIPKGIVFVGEFVAISLCWCPTALLYNYLTYVLYLACVILLYVGLTKERKWLLFAAGLCLGANVLVRFSNLPEAAMIVAVWAYAFLVWRQQKKVLAGKHTLWCLGGYLTALAVLLGYVFIKYGADTYVESIMRLFAMTENATDYKATSMLDGLINPFRQNLYWVIRMGVFVAAGMVGIAALKVAARKFPKTEKILLWLGRVGASVIAIVMVAWLYVRGFCSTEFYTYGAMLWPGVTFLMLTLVIAVIRILQSKCSVDEKLISGMVLLIVLLTSLGSNNELYPSMNNLFVAAPYTFWQSYKFVKNAEDGKWISFFPMKAGLVAFLGLFLFQIGGFGAGFVFGEATGLQNVTTVIENNETLQGIKMSPERAEIMTELTEFAKENDLIGREVITYGWIPAVSYYLQMPPAFNSWSDLDSYQYSVMEQALEDLATEIQNGQSECPVIIVENSDLTYQETPKYGLIAGFADGFNYDLIFENEKFAVYQAQ